MIFEAALATLDNDDARLSGPGAATLQRMRPLRARGESARLSRERALDEAAHALAKIWKR